MLRLRSALLAAVSLALVSSPFQSAAFAEDPVPTPEPGMDAPKEKAKKPEFDNDSIFKDWGICKGRGAKHCRGRADYWQSKGTVGKDLFWLGRMWQRGEDYPKAAATFEQFCGYRPPDGDEKALANNLTNRETARGALIEVWFNAREFAKSIAAAEKFREEFPTSVAALDSNTEQGQAERMLGDDAKAVASFERAAEKQFRALSNLVDLHLANGEIDKAKAAVAKFGPGLDKQSDKVKWTSELLDAIGTPAPALDVVVSVGPEGSVLPKAYDRVTLFTYWSVQSANVDRKLAALEMIRKKMGDKVNVIAVVTYKHYNVDTMKIEEGLTPEQEATGVTKLVGQSPERLPPCGIVTKEFLDAAKIKWDAQLTIIDAEGKLRWARINESKTYDMASLERVLEKLTATK